MREQLPDEPNGQLSRREFLGQLGAVGFSTAAAGSLPKSGTSGEVRTSGAPRADATVIAQVRLRGRAGLWDVSVQDGRIDRISPARVPSDGAHVIYGDGRLLTEGLVEHHAHLDKSLTADRVKWDDESIEADRKTWEKDIAEGRALRGFSVWRESSIKATFTEDDVFDRAVRAARMMAANGTTTIRSHAVVDVVRDLNCVKGLLRARDFLRPYVDIQIVVFPQDGDLLREPQTIEIVRRAMKLGTEAGAVMGVGGVPEVEPEHAGEYIDLVFRLAKEQGGFVDMHVDQPRDLRLFSHPIMVAKAREYGMQGQVTASHSYSLGYQPRERVLPVLDQMREAGVHLACLPYTFLEERVQLPREHGVLVSLIDDNVRDPWQRGGMGNLVEQAAIYRRLMLTSSNEGLEGIFDMITTCPGRAMGLKDFGLREGGRADLVLFDAESARDVVLHEVGPALVFKNGKVVAQAGRCLW